MIKLIASVLAFGLTMAVVVVAYAIATGLDARSHPSALETQVAREVRSLAIPRAIRNRPNPVAASPDVLADGLAHYADHCASCHGNNGDGNTEMGRGLFPKPPDMRQAATQQLTDGELFYIVEHGVRFTGMPGWSTGTESGENATWRLVHFIRHLPQLTQEDLERLETLAPRSPEQIRQQIEEEEFLKGGDATPPTNGHEHTEHTGAHQ
jgi:mono/diheme cytochrome c family protein